MRNDGIVEKMLGYIEKIFRYTEHMDYDTFIRQEILVEACIFNLSQLGELANKVDEEFQEKHSDIPWRQIYGLRNRIVHDYEGVNLKLVWEIIYKTARHRKPAVFLCKNIVTIQSGLRTRCADRAKMLNRDWDSAHREAILLPNPVTVQA